MKKFHIALSVQDIAASVSDYSQRLGADPIVIVDNQYALWRTASLNFSIRQVGTADSQIRHIGWESEDAEKFTESVDVNGITWEEFTAAQQAQEIIELWPHSHYKPEQA